MASGFQTSEAVQKVISMADFYRIRIFCLVKLHVHVLGSVTHVYNLRISDCVKISNFIISASGFLTS